MLKDCKDNVFDRKILDNSTLFGKAIYYTILGNEITEVDDQNEVNEAEDNTELVGE